MWFILPILSKVDEIVQYIRDVDKQQPYHLFEDDAAFTEKTHQRSEAGEL